ncbi:MAG TPA: DUF1080 domain-containing protein [Bryobacteraceae bacterium]|nr:DUF1080 domain-containing protein [Bryobacteraceae bacterium]
MLSTSLGTWVIFAAAAIAPAAGQSTGWTQLFNGRDLGGWEHVGAGSAAVSHGLIRVCGDMGLLWWKGGKIGNAVLRVTYRTEGKIGNSGVYIRIPIEPREPWMPVHYGYEVQIESDPARFHEGDYHVTGTLYSLTKALARPSRPSPEWNVMEITLRGPRTIVFVNGVKVTDYTEGRPVPPRKFDYEPLRGPRPDEGYIGLQNDGKEPVLFKEVALKHLAGR